jgi:hypothetical protein
MNRTTITPEKRYPTGQAQPVRRPKRKIAKRTQQPADSKRKSKILNPRIARFEPGLNLFEPTKTRKTQTEPNKPRLLVSPKTTASYLCSSVSIPAQK